MKDFFEMENVKQRKVELIFKHVINNLNHSKIKLDITDDDFVNEFAKEFIRTVDLIKIKRLK